MAEDTRARLLTGKLHALAGPHLAEEPADADFPGGAALLAGDAAWLLLEDQAVTALGPALVWADRRRAGAVHVVVTDEDAAGVVARRAARFAPAPSVWSVTGTAIERAVPSPPAGPGPVPAAPELAELLVDADLEVVVEGGVVRGEVLGLEVARIVHGETSWGVPLDEPRLEVGVGLADRELTGALHAGLTPREQLDRAAEVVRRHRHPDAPPHPLNQLVPERWLRARLVADPARVGMAELRPVPAAIPRANLREKGIAVAVGTRDDGRAAVVACSVGIDLDLVPAAADAQLLHASHADLVLVVPERDDHAVTRTLAGRLDPPAEVVALAGDWRR